MLLDHDQALGSILGIISSPPFQALAGTAPIIPIRKATQRRVPCPKEVMAGAPWSRGVWEVLDACAQKPGSFVKWLRETGRTGINRGLVPARCRDAKLLTPQGWQDWKRAPFCASDWLLPRHSKMQLQQLSTLNVLSESALRSPPLHTPSTGRDACAHCHAHCHAKLVTACVSCRRRQIPRGTPPGLSLSQSPETRDTNSGVEILEFIAVSSGEGAPALPEQVLQSVVIVQRARAPEQRFDLPGQLILAPRTLPVLLSPRLTDSGDLEKLFPGRLDGAGLVDTLDLMIDQLDDGRCSVWGRLLTVIGRRHGSGIAHPRRVLLLEAKGTNGHRSGGPDIPKGCLPPQLLRPGCECDQVHVVGCMDVIGPVNMAEFESIALVPRGGPHARPMGQTHEAGRALQRGDVNELGGASG